MTSLQKFNPPHETQHDDIRKAKLCQGVCFTHMVANMYNQKHKGKLSLNIDEIEMSKQSSKLMGFLEDTFIKRGFVFDNLIKVYSKTNLPQCDLRVKNCKKLSTVKETINALKKGLPVAFGMRGGITSSGYVGKPMIHKFRPSLNPLKNGHMVMIDSWNDKEKYFEAENWNPNTQRLRIYLDDFKPQSLYTFEITK